MQALAKGACVDVFWTEDNTWYTGVVIAVSRDGVARVLYEPDYARQPRHERMRVHDMNDVRWRRSSQARV